MAARRDKFSSPFSQQFRLYFLCECGAHTVVNGSNIPNEVHLAKHGGYDLERPTEFFEKYGQYILLMMEMFKIGFQVAGIVVPALSDLKIAEGMERVEKGIKLSKSTIGALVDESIGYIQDIKDKQSSPVIHPTDRCAELDKQEVLEGADLRQLDSYLRIQDRGRTLGNLYRIVTSAGNVKWVCMDHYRTNYRENTTELLRNFVKVNGGAFDEELGVVKCDLVQVAARDFYKAISSARGIREMAIKFCWDATVDDLRKFRDAMGESNIMHLTIDGIALKSSALDSMVQRRRYKPIMDLMWNGRIKSMHIKNIDKLYSQLGDAPSAKADQLRVLSVGSRFVANDPKMMAALTKILDLCPSLVELTLNCDLLVQIFQVIQVKVASHQALKTVTLTTSTPDIVMSFSKGRLDEVSAVVYRCRIVKQDDPDFLQQGHLSHEHLDFLLEGHLTALTVKQIAETKAEHSLLSKTLFKNPDLSKIDIGADPNTYPSLINQYISMRNDHRKKGRALKPCQFRLHDVNGSEKGKDTITAEVTFGYTAAPSDVSIDLHMGSNSSSLGTKMNDLFREYGWAFKSLTTSRTLEDLHLTHLSNPVIGKKYKLTSLVLNPTSLSSQGLFQLDTILYNFTNLQHICFYLDKLEVEAQQVKALELLRRYGKRLEGLTLRGDEACRWLGRFGEEAISRCTVPNLSAFSVIGGKLQLIPSDQVTWITNMVAPPITPSASSSTSVSSGQSDAWRPLQSVSLHSIHFMRVDWEIFISALDLTIIETLSLNSTNFSQDNLAQLANRLPEDGANVVLETLHVYDTDLARKQTCSSLVQLLKTFKTRTMGAKIEGL
ncbi:hypothetical protein BGX28_002396 [Mortierella sp. GBA30]|nr:hypothetical protein BGX28_002396 [Mortierella sp. GBA30]